jgi:hypothetical protein
VRILVTAALAACGANHASHATPPDDVTWGRVDRDLVLGLVVRGETLTAVFENRGAQPLTVIRDSVCFQLEGAGNHYEVCTDNGPTRLDREGTFVDVAPQHRYTVDIDLYAKAHRVVGRDGGEAMTPGFYHVHASYNSDTAAVGRWWTGMLEAGPISVEIR